MTRRKVCASGPARFPVFRHALPKPAQQQSLHIGERSVHEEGNACTLGVNERRLAHRPLSTVEVNIDQSVLVMRR